MKVIQILILFVAFSVVCYIIIQSDMQDNGQARKCECTLPRDMSFANRDAKTLSCNNTYPEINGGLLASRFSTLEELKTVVHIEYFNPPTAADTIGKNAMVRLSHCSNGVAVSSELKAGIDQGEIMKIRNQGLWEKFWLAVRCPFAVFNRSNLFKINDLARRKPYRFGEGDVAFYDLAEASLANITTKELAFRFPRDTGEKGYINSFNHITAQAFLTSCFSEAMADFVSDVHERYHMPELLTGRFSSKQLTDPDNNPVDNYVDIINNEWGQEIGKQLKKKYNIHQETYWTPELLTDYLNDLQSYYSGAFQIGFKPYSIEDEVIIRYAEKINIVMQQKLPM